MTARTPTNEQLMAEMGWVRQLARALLRDDAGAEDVAQDAWLVAAAQQPDADRPLRPWLARVVVQLVRGQRRGTARRGERDAVFDRERVDVGAVPTPAELIERVELQRAVAHEVLALAEPYRSTVLLHFFERYSSAEIARRLDVPDGTVRRRLKVGLDQLRAALRDRPDPPKRGWLAALAPLAGFPRPEPSATAAIGVLAMKKLTAIVVLLVILAAVLLLWGGSSLWRRHTSADSGAPLAASGSGAPSSQTFAGAAPPLEPIPAWLAQSGAPPRTIAGRVIARGGPVAGARVVLGLDVVGERANTSAVPDAWPHILEPIATATTGPDGTFEFGTQPAAAFTVSASADGYAPAARHLASADPHAPAGHLVLELGDCSSRWFGTVADASGGGIAKARVAVAGLSGTETDAAGAYSLCVAPQEAWGPLQAQVRVEADGYGTLMQTMPTVGELRHDFVLVPEAVLVGRVTTADGRPVASARVIATPNGMERAHHATIGWATSDRDGRFRVAGLAPGGFQLTATADGRATAAPLAALARPTRTSQELQVVLGRLAAVRGHVVMDGVPVAGANVMAIRNGEPVGSAISQADGSFMLAGIPPGSTAFLALPYRVLSPTSVSIGAGGSDDVRIDVAKLASIHGHVTRGGKPVAGADLMVISFARAVVYGPSPAATSDASGAYVIEGLGGGPATLHAWDYAGKAFAKDRSIDIVAGADQAVDVVLDHAGAVEGVVVDEDGHPVGGADVQLELAEPGGDDACEAITDGSGRFDCTMLLGGDYRPTIEPSAGARRGLDPATGDHFELLHVPTSDALRGVRLAVKNARFTIRGSVVDDTGAPVADVQVEAIGPNFSPMDLPSAMTDANGHFAITDLAHGTYSLHARADDGSETEVLGVAAGTDSTVIALSRAGGIDGTLAGFSATPIVTIHGLTPDMHTGGTAIVDGATFAMPGLPPGRYTVQANAGAQVDGQLVEVRSRETAHVALQSRGGGTIEGVVTELGSHAPVVGMRCDANLSMGGQMEPVPADPAQQGITDAAGHFTTSAPLGRVRIFCFSPAPGPLSAAGTDVDVTPSAPAKVSVFSVRALTAGPPHDRPFTLLGLVLPITVAQVQAGTAAATAGLLAGDQLVTIDGVSLQGVLSDGAMTLVANHGGGTPLVLGVQRGSTALTITVH